MEPYGTQNSNDMPFATMSGAMKHIMHGSNEIVFDVLDDIILNFTVCTLTYIMSVAVCSTCSEAFLTMSHIS